MSELLRWEFDMFAIFSSKYDTNRNLSLYVFVKGRSIGKRVRLFHRLSVFSIVCPSFPSFVRLFHRLSVFSIVCPSFPSFVRLFHRLSVFSIVCPSFPSFVRLFHRCPSFPSFVRLFHRCPSFPSFVRCPASVVRRPCPRFPIDRRI